ncbi:acyl-CoA dehydrogenase [Halorhodospira neutriphila]|uniref:Acyl-CoA dehydrogenase n=1 Tax=Halorhodospira neutriphila TaxID=168379 RepID=A0ABS1E7L2_9GAMM|nr:acyl-CoA dehydrogenase [Halorhodospira neutriphila]MBK1726809.1 acyl-CoA dehydrogenase [Halorhodospira neutriphila]
MATYQPPIRDQRFVIEELIGLDRLDGLAGVEPVTPELLGAVLEEAGRLAGEVWAPLNRAGDRQGCRLEDGRVRLPEGFADAYRAFVDGGWNGIGADPQRGGQGLPEVAATATQEMWHGANMALALAPMLSAGATELLAQHGDEPLRARYLERLVSGEWAGTMDLSEPQAGSDLGAVRMQAVPDEAGGCYRLYGEKIYITWGEHEAAENIVHLVLARTPDAPAGHKGLSLFLVPKYLAAADGSLGARNDLRCTGLEEKLGIHASPTCTLRYGDGEGAVGYLVGERHRGLYHMFTMMNESRHKVGVQGVGVAERAYQLARDFARQRVQGRRPGGGEDVPIIAHPDVRRMLMAMRAPTEAMRALALLTAAEMDTARHGADAEARERAQRRVDLLTPLVKAVATEQAVEAASLGIQVHGGVGYTEEAEAAQLLRDVRIAPIYEGTNGILGQDFTLRKVLKDGGETLAALLAEADETVAGLRGAAALSGLGDALAEAVAALRASTERLLVGGDDPLAALTAATPYLMQAGLVLGGWQMGRAALIAHEAVQAGRGDTDFYAAKLHTARFYMRHTLPRAHGYTPAVQGGSDELEAVTDTQW